MGNGKRNDRKNVPVPPRTYHGRSKECQVTETNFPVILNNKFCEILPKTRKFLFTIKAFESLETAVSAVMVFQKYSYFPKNHGHIFELLDTLCSEWATRFFSSSESIEVNFGSEFGPESSKICEKKLWAQLLLNLAKYPLKTHPKLQKSENPMLFRFKRRLTTEKKKPWWQMIQFATEIHEMLRILISK